MFDSANSFLFEIHGGFFKTMNNKGLFVAMQVNGRVCALASTRPWFSL